MTFSQVTIADWRAQVERELDGAPFEETLVCETPEGLSIQPLYIEAPPVEVAMPEAPFRICMRHDVTDAAAIAADLDGGAGALWLRAGVDLAAVMRQLESRDLQLIVDLPESRDALVEGVRSKRVAIAASDALAPSAAGDSTLLLSTLRFHEAGADAADEIALVLSLAAAQLRAWLDSGIDLDSAARRIGVQIAVGRDTFGELCKLRALRICWGKLLAVSGAKDTSLATLHAVCSSRTLTERDPWVNHLRTTTQLFAAILGGANLVTPTSYDEALGAPSGLGRRVARNAGLVLREESHLGRVVDAAAGSFYLDSRTDELARLGWRRFRDVEREGGIRRLRESGQLRERLAKSWRERAVAFAKRRDAITGVSEFANLDEKSPIRDHAAAPSPEDDGVLPAHRDAEAFEGLRDRFEALAARGEATHVVLVTLGPAAEHRARVSFASGFFAAGGLRARTGEAAPAGAVACICGSDGRYGTEAAALARSLKSAGCARVLLVGRPGALEPALREAGVDAFIHLGCDVVATLAGLPGAGA